MTTDLFSPPVAFAPIDVIPSSLCFELLLSARTPVSHHDPAVTDQSNRQLFNRQRQLMLGPQSVNLPGQSAIDALCAAHPVPDRMADLFADVTFPQFMASALVRLFVDLYNSTDGEGLFSGMERYARLEARLHQSAVCAPTLRSLWDRLTNSMQVSIHGGDHDALLFGLLAVPSGLQQMVLRCLSSEYRSVISLARLWHATNKLAVPEYAAKIGEAPVEAMVRLHFDGGQLVAGSEVAQVVEVPTITGNSLRHQVVREPAWLHLCKALGLDAGQPGQGPVPAGVEAIFINGGNIASGAKQPSNPFGLSNKARQLYPSLDLLGGVTDSFDLGESRLRVAGWLVCAENREALAGSAAYDRPAATVSVFDMLDDVTLTRQAGRLGLGQMIYDMECLCPGAQILCRLSLSPYTPQLTRGALVAAIETYLLEDGTIGGQAARGFGHCDGKWLTDLGSEVVADCAAYETYLVENREQLRTGMVDGTLGTGARILS